MPGMIRPLRTGWPSRRWRQHAGRARHVAESIAAQAGACGPADDRRTGVEACARYLTNNTEYLRYDQALASGWPIATEVVEGRAGI